MSVKISYFTQVTQVRNNKEYEQQSAAYQAAQQKFQQELADWKSSHHVSGNTVSASEVNQQLVLGHEPNATHTIDYVSSFLTPSSDLLNETGKGKLYETKSSITGEVLQVTYKNLSHSSYTDSDGNKHLISKIVFTFSDLNHNYMKVNGKSYLIVKDDPAAGFWYEGSNGITLKETFYDQDGNPINIEPGTGFLAVTSLNAAYGNLAAGTVEKTGSPVHVESVRVLNGGTPVALLSSSIQVVGNQLVSPSTNDYANDGKGNVVFGLQNGTTVSSPQSTSTTWQGDNWDVNPSETYWGTGLVSLNGSSVTLRFESATQVRDEGTWATTQTIIPQTPGPQYNGPEKPTLKTTEVSYHHDVTLKY